MRVGGTHKIVSKTNVHAIPVASTAVVYTRSFDLRKGLFFGLWAILASAGSPDVKVELELAPTQPTEAQEGVAATDLFAIKASDTIFAQINDKVANVTTVAPVPMSYGRYKLTGLGENPSDTTITLWHFQQDEA